MNINEILSEYSDNYSLLYDDPVILPREDYRELVNIGDMLIMRMRPLVTELCKARGDVFSSDREIAALALTFIGLGLYECENPGIRALAAGRKECILP